MTQEGGPRGLIRPATSQDGELTREVVLKQIERLRYPTFQPQASFEAQAVYRVVRKQGLELLREHLWELLILRYKQSQEGLMQALVGIGRRAGERREALMFPELNNNQARRPLVKPKVAYKPNSPYTGVPEPRDLPGGTSYITFSFREEAPEHQRFVASVVGKDGRLGTYRYGRTVEDAEARVLEAWEQRRLGLT